MFVFVVSTEWGTGIAADDVIGHVELARAMLTEIIAAAQPNATLFAFCMEPLPSFGENNPIGQRPSHDVPISA